MRRLTRKYLIALPPKPKEQKILSQFCTASAKWNVSVRDVETFMVKSIRRVLSESKMHSSIRV